MNVYQVLDNRCKLLETNMYMDYGTPATTIKSSNVFLSAFKKRATTFSAFILAIAILVVLDNAFTLVQKVNKIQFPAVLGIATPDSSLSMSAPGVNKDEIGNYLFPSGEVAVLLNLESGNVNQIDSVEAVLHYDPTILSASSVDFNQTLANQYLKNDPLKCNPIYIEKNANGSETGTIRIARTAIPLPSECPPAVPADTSNTVFPSYVPMPKATTGAFALIKFNTLKNITVPSLISYEYNLIFPDPNNALNDSNVVAYTAPADRDGNAYDVLNKVTNLSFVVGPQPLPIDNTPPTVSITAPVNGSTLSGTVNLTANAADDKGLAKVDFIVDGVIKCSPTAAPYTCALDTSVYSNGTTHNITVKAYDTAQPVANTATDTVTVSICNGDCAAPTAPTNLKSENVSFNLLSLNWTASTDDKGVTGYYIYRKVSSDNSFSQVGNSTTTTYTDNSVLANTEYNYQVKAYDASQNFSPASNIVTVKTTVAPDTTPPSAPTNLSGSAISKSQINLNWSASNDDANGTGVAGYNVYRKLSGDYAKVNSSLITNTNFGDSSLASSTTYTYYVTAVDKANNESAKSQEVTVKTLDDVISNGAITGTIVDSNTRAPIANVKVILSSKYGKKSTVTDANGKYLISNLTPEVYTAKYSVAKYDTQTITITVQNGSPTLQDIAMTQNIGQGKNR